MTADHDALDERYRHCIYCRADCWPEPGQRQHHKHCPVTLGLYPITWREADPSGTPPRCCSCSELFRFGDQYALLDADSGRPAVSPERGEVVCLGCAASAAVAS